VKEPGARQRSPTPLPLKEHGDACGAANIATVNNSFERVRFLDVSQKPDRALHLFTVATA
jgi:hypothetical protein